MECTVRAHAIVADYSVRQVVVVSHDRCFHVGFFFPAVASSLTLHQEIVLCLQFVLGIAISQQDRPHLAYQQIGEQRARQHDGEKVDQADE